MKQTVYQTLTLKFREVLRATQQAQAEYKHAAHSKIKRQLAIVMPEANEESLNDLAKDPEAANKVLNEQIMGKAHRKIQNAVDDIQEKCKDILRLEKVATLLVILV